LSNSPARILIGEILLKHQRQLILLQRIVQRNVRPLQTRSMVLTRIRVALVDVLLAIFARKARKTVALVVVD
jgi:hypothetical protein